MRAQGPAMHVEVVRAWPDRLWRQSVQLAPGATVGEAIQASGALHDFPELAGPGLAAGIFGRLANSTQLLADGDRVELYRPLHFDPKTSRRRRAAHKLAQRQAAASRNSSRARP
jgi:putative ubiquitin-RnfH superfamily antitoxin RatB of RatAB toxin-antitoxin module